MLKLSGALLAVAAIVASPLLVAAPAEAACAAPGPEQLSYHQMIARGTTGDDYYHRMIIGRVTTIRDPGKRGGQAIAVLHVAAHPTGFVPNVARVRFKAHRPGTAFVSEYFPGFRIGDRYVVIGRRTHDGSYEFSPWCSGSKRVHRWRYRHLVRLADAA